MPREYNDCMTDHENQPPTFTKCAILAGLAVILLVVGMLFGVVLTSLTAIIVVTFPEAVGVALGAVFILVAIRWLNRRDNPARRAPRPLPEQSSRSLLLRLAEQVSDGPNLSASEIDRRIYAGDRVF